MVGFPVMSRFYPTFFAIGLSVTVGACGATSNEPCTQNDVGQIVAAHEARLASKCFGQGKDCPARKEENARFKEELRAWVRCDAESEPVR